MNQIKRILAPTDLSVLSQVGVRYALDLAKALGAEVTVFYVINNDELIRSGGGSIRDEIGASTYNKSKRIVNIVERYQSALSRFLGTNFADMIPSVKVREKVEIGIPDKNIVDRAKAEQTDLIVISTHGRTGLSHVLLGSVTEKVVRNAPCPVISVNPQRDAGLARKAAATG